jgi:uncharacterized protein YutE (UPF0331/DUF86 family)
MINGDIIKIRLLEIDENLKILEELRASDIDTFRADPKLFKLAERCLEVCIQAILDICHHIIADKNLPRPNDNAEAIELLGRNNILPEKFARHIMPMAGLRNILIHEYLKIDTAKTYQHLQNIQDFREFQKYIIAYLKTL